MRDENQCLHGRDAHAPLAFASHTLSSHFRISEAAFGIIRLRGQKVALIPEVRMFWQHEFLNNARNINASLDGGSGAGVTSQFGER